VKPAPKRPEPQSYPERIEIWDKAIAGFEARDRDSGMPTPGGIVFVGSSSIVKWTTLAADFPGLPVLNRGFGGSQIADSTYYAGRIVLPYKPRTVVLYAGDNDIAAGHTTEQVVGDFQTFARKVRDALPETKLLFLAIKPSPSRARLEPEMVAANAAIARWMGGQPNMTFVDVHPPMLGPDGQARPELFGPDRLHMNAEGYRLWTKVLAPYLP
jgi:lysophospholipase L1-like esterase